ncbi:hypothetical protein DENIS_2247 [Desulfonema ishimotonii]|uniref:Rhodanese domain-containing protein n=2 Tax=Desulfonema ishimotonii TaxID=45657 RepID=A0A401FWD6_9BACT|nr:hypothetical protein DENIS_2247 [Desulfonema ishimotonii]
MKNRKFANSLTIFFTGLTLFFFCWLAGASAGEVAKMTKEELRNKLGRSDLVVMDVRTGKSWNNSEFKIRSARRESPDQVGTWAAGYPKDKVIVLYCA